MSACSSSSSAQRMVAPAAASSSSSSPAPVQTTSSQAYFAKLDSLINEFKIIGSLEEGERPCQDKSTKTIYSKYTKATETGILGAFKRLGQAGHRYLSGNKTEKTLQRVDQLAQETLNLLNTTSAPYDFYSNFKTRHQKLQTLLEFMEQSSRADGALAKLCRTATSSASNAKSRTEIDAETLRTKFHSTTEKVRLASTALAQKVAEYNHVQNMSDDKQFPPMKEHLREMLSLLFKVGGDLQNMNVNAFQDLSLTKVKEVLSEHFGEAVTNDVVELYGLNGKLKIGYKDFQALVAGIVANLTIEDVRHILRSEFMCTSLGLGPVNNEAELADVLAKVRNIDIGGLEDVSSDAPYYTQLSGDLSFLSDCLQISDYNFNESQFESRVAGFKPFGYTEHLSRFYSYSFHQTKDHRFRDGTLFPLYDQEGNLICREGHHILGKDYIFTLGVLPVQGLSKDQTTMQVVFRGTYDVGSVIRDVSPFEQTKEKFARGGPGRETYLKNRDELYENFVKVFARRPALTQIEITGHSLGACDAMRFTSQFTENRVRDDRLALINSIKLFSYNGPAVESDFSTQFEASARALEEQNVAIHLRYFPNGVDIVSEFGKYFPGHLASDAARPGNLNISWVQFNHMLERHQTDSLMDAAHEGSVQAGKNAISRRFDAHCHPFLSETNRDSRQAVNPAYIRYFVTTSDEDRARAGAGREVPVADLNQVLTTDFKFETYTAASSSR